MCFSASCRNAQSNAGLILEKNTETMRRNEKNEYFFSKLKKDKNKKQYAGLAGI